MSEKNVNNHSEEVNQELSDGELNDVAGGLSNEPALRKKGFNPKLGLSNEPSIKPKDGLVRGKFMGKASNFTIKNTGPSD